MTLMRFGLVRSCFTLATLLVGLAGCSEAATKSANDDGADEGTDGNGDGSSDGSDTAGADAGGLEVVFQGEGVECGEKRCKDALVKDTPFGANGCCVDAKTAACGVDMTALGLLIGLSDPGCEQLDKPGSAAASCPESEPIQALIPGQSTAPVVLSGCCQATGHCGYSADFGNIGFGCVGPERFGKKAGVACDYAP
jgi:hypothetical protein